jgi:hypothetical protein
MYNILTQNVKPKKFFSAAQTEYNYVYNRYLNNHEEKVKVEKEVERLNAAEKYWKKNDYDPIRVRFIDNEKENHFQKTVEDEKNNWGKNRKIRIAR